MADQAWDEPVVVKIDRSQPIPIETEDGVLIAVHGDGTVTRIPRTGEASNG